MDNWIVGAAAGAGYIAQHWKSLMRGEQSKSGLSSWGSNFVKSNQLQDKKGTFRKNLGGDKRLIVGDTVPQDGFTTEIASTSGVDGENLVKLGCYEDSVLSTLRLSSGFLSIGDLRGDQQAMDVDGGVGESNGGELGSPYCFSRNRSILRRKGTSKHLIKPVTSLESCLMAQLYKERAEMDELMFDKIPSPSMPTMRPLIVTDGSRIISRATVNSFGGHTQTVENKLQKESYSEENKTVFGVPPLPNIVPMAIQRKTRVKKGKERGGRLSSSSKMACGKHSNSQDGSSHGALLFCLGISVGIISSLLASNREVDKLNELLKQTENLVQDLQEELEMKDSLTVKELAVENYESQDTHGYSHENEAPHAISPGQNLDELTEHYHKDFHDQKADEDSMSKIEAELEAELERLEVNMNSSSLEGKLSDLVEGDPNFVPDIVHGELRADMFGTQSGAQPYADRDGSGSSTTHSANYAVSPRELSLRLHELLQSRLEERVMELETALQNSQIKALRQYLESERTKRWREFSNSNSGASSIQQSPVEEDQSLADQPVVINLSGEALDAYNEAYDVFSKINDANEDDSKDHVEDLHSFDQNGGSHSISTSLNDIVTSEDDNENGDEDDEMEKLLIKQILEKARKGSPVVLNAQKALFSMDENDH